MQMHTQNFQILIKPIWVFLLFWDLLHSNGINHGINYKILKMKMKNHRTLSFSANFLLRPSSSFFLLLLFLFCLPASASSFLVLCAIFSPFQLFFNFSSLFPFLFDLCAAALSNKKKVLLPFHVICYLPLKFLSFNYSFLFFLNFGDVSFSFFIISIIKWYDTCILFL
jgi:hypothetical protein